MNITYKTDATEKFIIMCDIEKRAKQLVESMKVVDGHTFAAGIVGYRYPKVLWREAKDAGFVKEADGRWIGFTSSYNGEEATAEEAYMLALKEKKEELAATGTNGSFLDNVSLYYYLT